MELIYFALILGVLLTAIFAPGLLLKLVVYFILLCIVVMLLTGCAGENWKFTPNGKVKADDTTIKEKKLEVEEIQGQFEYRF